MYQPMMFKIVSGHQDTSHLRNNASIHNFDWKTMYQ